MKERIVEAKITGIDKEGKGSGEFVDGAGEKKPLRVPFCMPKDKVEASIRKKQRGIFSGRLLRVIEGAEERIEPRCIHFGTCGGCSLQHVPYPSQLAFKQGLIERYFAGLGPISPIIECEKHWNYRNKMEFSFSQDKEGNRFLGLFLSQSRGRVFNVSECHLVSPWFAEDLKKVRLWWNSTALKAYHPASNTGTLRTLTFREGITTGDRMAMLTVSGNPDYALHQPEIQAFQRLFDPERYSLYLRVQQAIKGQPTEFFELHLQGPEVIRETLRISLGPDRISEVEFHISPSAFFQPNSGQAEKLYQKALQLCALTKEDLVYDLYCGTGTLGLLSARFVKSVLGIELSPESSLDARENAKRNGIKNIEILTGSVGEILKEKRLTPTLVLIDPPRAGLDARALAEIIALKSPKIAYISCNPETQSRDVKLLIEAGYAIKEIQPVDQFPHTPHIENIAVLVYTPKK